MRWEEDEFDVGHFEIEEPVGKELLHRDRGKKQSWESSACTRARKRMDETHG